jgi:hypothetical protein
MFFACFDQFWLCLAYLGRVGVRWVGVCKPDKFKLAFFTFVFLIYSYFFGVLDPEKLKEHETVDSKQSKNIFYIVHGLFVVFLKFLLTNIWFQKLPNMQLLLILQKLLEAFSFFDMLVGSITGIVGLSGIRGCIKGGRACSCLSLKKRKCND